MSVIPEAARTAARALATTIERDLLLYSGSIERRLDLRFIELVDASRRFDQCTLLLTTHGGDPDAAYKMARYLQQRYHEVAVLVVGLCKSAGTLMAVGGHEVVFSPYGELGPLDVQTYRKDNLAGLESGLNISEALFALESRASQLFHNTVMDIIGASGGIISFPGAADAAADVVRSLYGPVFSRIDPEDVGGLTRSMRIAEDYGKRLDRVACNLRPRSIELLVRTYSSHSFVIDFKEAELLFERVRMATSAEIALVKALGDLARWQLPTDQEPVMSVLSADEENDDGASDHTSGTRSGGPASDGGDPAPAGASPDA